MKIKWRRRGVTTNATQKFYENNLSGTFRDIKPQYNIEKLQL